MKSKMSFFDPTLLKKNISRFAPAWALFGLLLFLTGPLPLLRRLTGSFGGTLLAEAKDIWETLSFVYIWYAFFAAALFAVLVFKYLYKTRSAYMLHAFPMTRSCLFVTNAVSGLLFFLVPMLVNGLLLLGVLRLLQVSGQALAVWSLMGASLLVYLCFYGVAVFAMVLAGNGAVGILSYFALNILPLALPVLLLLPVRFYLYGVDLNLPDWMLLLAPIVGLHERLIEGGGLWVLLGIYAAVGLALLGLAWYHNRVRQVERAGDAMAYPWARVAFRLIFTLCCALGLGWILAALFGALNDKTVAYLPYALLGCFLGWFGSTMMLERSVKVFKNKKIWLGFAVFAGVLILGTMALRYDALGIRRRVPETAQVASVEIWTREDRDWEGPSDRITLTDPGDIDLIRQVHSSALESYSPNDSLGDLFGTAYGVHIRYHLEGGGTLTRVYRIHNYEDSQPLARLYSRPEICVAYYQEALPQSFRWASLEGVTEYELTEDGQMVGYSESSGEIRDPQALREAVLADAAAGRLPIYNRLTAYGDASWMEGGRVDTLNIYFNLSPELGMDLRIFTTATETIALFRK